MQIEMKLSYNTRNGNILAKPVSPVYLKSLGDNLAESEYTDIGDAVKELGRENVLAALQGFSPVVMVEVGE